MYRYFLKAVCLSAALVLGVTAFAGAQMMLDPEEVKVKAGDKVTLKLMSTDPVKGLVGVELELKFDGSQVTFKGFKPGGILKGAQALPPQITNSGAKIAVALMGGQANADGPEMLGELTFQVSDKLSHGTEVMLVSGSFGSTGGTKKFNLGRATMIHNADAAAAKIGGGQGQPPPGGGQGQPPPGGSFGQPPPPPPGKGMPSDAEIKMMFERWKQSPEAKDLDGDRDVDMDDFKVFMDKMMGGRHGQQGGGHGQPPPGGPMGGPMGGGKGQPPPGGPGGPPMGGPGGPGGHQMGGGPGGPPMGGPGGSGGGHQMGGPMDGPSPEEMIKELPAALQPSFKQTLEVEKASEKAHMEAELKMLKSVQQTLEDTKRYLGKAKPEEKEVIGKVLWFFEHQGGGDHGGPMGGPGGHQMGGPGGHQMGGPGGHQMGGGPKDVDQLVGRMIEQVAQDIEHLQNALREMR